MDIDAGFCLHNYLNSIVLQLEPIKLSVWMRVRGILISIPSDNINILITSISNLIIINLLKFVTFSVHKTLEYVYNALDWESNADDLIDADMRLEWRGTF